MKNKRLKKLMSERPSKHMDEKDGEMTDYQAYNPYADFDPETRQNPYHGDKKKKKYPKKTDMMGYD